MSGQYRCAFGCSISRRIALCLMALCRQEARSRGGNQWPGPLAAPWLSRHATAWCHWQVRGLEAHRPFGLLFLVVQLVVPLSNVRGKAGLSGVLLSSTSSYGRRCFPSDQYQLLHPRRVVPLVAVNQDQHHDRTICTVSRSRQRSCKDEGTDIEQSRPLCQVIRGISVDRVIVKICPLRIGWLLQDAYCLD